MANAWDDFCEAYDVLVGEKEYKPEPGGYWDRFYKKHGELVEYRQEAYYDVKVYADGYEERISIGD